MALVTGFFVNLVIISFSMRVAIISDIHEDFQYLERALNILDSAGYDMLVCLGDLTGYAPLYHSHTPDANACIDLVKEKSTICLAGNHDLFTSQRLPSYHLEKSIPENWYDLTLKQRYEVSNNSLWLYEEEVLPILSNENASYLESLTEFEILEVDGKRMLFSHFIQPDLAGVERWFPYRITELRPHFKFMEESNCNIAFVGHFHPNGVTPVNKLFWSAPCFETFKVNRKPRIILSPCIVRSGKSSSCIIFDTKKSTVTPYQIKLNQ